MSTTVTRWWWVRHAPVLNTDGRCYGQHDVECDTTDAESFRGLGAMLPRGALLITSDLARTRLTAAAIAAAGLDLPAPIAEPAFREQSFGAWQGMRYDEIRDARGSRHPFWLAPAYERPPGGESFADLLARLAPAVHRLSREHAGRDIVSVGHGGTIRAALALALGMHPEAALAFSVDHLSLTRIDHVAEADGTGQWRVVTVNRRPRIDGPAA